MKNELRWVLVFFSSSVFLLLVIMGVNYLVDPGYQYHHNDALRKAEDQLATDFQNAEVGIVFNGNEQVLAHSLAKVNSAHDCIVLGSSRALQIGTLRGNEMRKHCTEALNLSVFGASLEDFLILSNQILKRETLPTTIFWEVSPWLLKWNMDKRYLIYGQELNDSLAENPFPSRSVPFTSNALLTHLRNLTNFEYTVLSMKRLLKHPLEALQPNISEQFYAVEPFNFNEGLTSKVRLKDGSLVYDATHLKEKRTGEDYVESGDYKLVGTIFDEELLSELESYLRALTQKTQLVLVLAPYHGNVFRAENSRNTIYLETVEREIKALAERIGVSVLGSYNPVKIPCTKDEFYDFMHPTAECIDRVFAGTARQELL